jgi:uncharacterized membrane protein YuzA (DUF378 family)
VRALAAKDPPSPVIGGEATPMRTIDIIAASLLVIGGLNWGLVGLFETDLVASLFGTSALAKLVYVLVGLAAVYQVVGLRAIQRRWHVRPAAA